MKYVKINNTGKLISLEPTNWGKPYEDLFKQTDVSGYDVFKVYSYNNYDNPLQISDETLCKQKGSCWSEIFRDVIRKGEKGTDDKGRLHLTYISRFCTEFEKAHNVWAPGVGWYVPTDDGWFYPGTLVPFETVENREEALKRLESNGVSGNYVSKFFRIHSHDSDRYVSRNFVPDRPFFGRFGIVACEHPSNMGYEWVGSRPKIELHECIMEIIK